MKKFIAAFDGLKYSKSTRDYAIKMTKENKGHLVGVMLNDITHHSFRIYDVVAEKGGVSVNRGKQLLESDEDKRRGAAIDFKKTCEKEGIEFTLHHNRCIAIQELLHESIYSDLLVMNKKENFTFYKDNPPTQFIRDLLPHIECPILLVPKTFTSINKVVLLYDGEPSSVYAIKMFSYTLPSLKEVPIEVLTVKDPDLDLHLPDNGLMKEFMKRHFPKAKYSVLQGVPAEQIVDHLKQNEDNTLVVLGAYRRSMVSRWFRKSMADVLMKELHFPLFIAHT